MGLLSRDSDGGGRHVDLVPAPCPSGSRPFALDGEDRASMLIQLENILNRTHRLEEHLIVAAARVGGVCSPWTEEQLGALCDAAKALARAVRSAPPAE